MPRGLRDLAAYGIGYSAQTNAYLLLLTDRYPSSDPGSPARWRSPTHPVELEFTRRPVAAAAARPLPAPARAATPRLAGALDGACAVLAAVAGWLVAPFPGRLPRSLHRFLAAYVRYATHVDARFST